MKDDQFSPRRQKKRDRFLKVAVRRTRNTLRCIRLLSKCANRSSYEYTSAEVEKIFAAIQEATQRARMGFKKDQLVKFTLREEVEEAEVDAEEEP
jgi:hypothetical protein